MTARLTVLCALLSVGCVSSRTGAAVAWPEAVGGEDAEIVASSPVPAGIRLGGHYGERIGRSGEETFHAGLDFAAPTGTEIFAVADGVVTAVAHEEDDHTRFAGYGNAVVVHHPALGVWTMYAHLSAVTVAEGENTELALELGVAVDLRRIRPQQRTQPVIVRIGADEVRLAIEDMAQVQLGLEDAAENRLEALAAEVLERRPARQRSGRGA